MNKPLVFIDGAEGTTGLQMRSRLETRDDIRLITLEDDVRKDRGRRKEAINSADLVVVCLPDDAAREAVTLIDNPHTRVLDASSAHRTADGWVYGLPELAPDRRELIKSSRFVSNPGCHATGAVMLLAPLTRAGLIPENYPVSITSLTGYTGGGKKMIAEYRAADRETRWDLNSPRSYALTQNHKHIPEIMKYSGLAARPSFVPIVADFPQGMQVIVPLSVDGLRGNALAIYREVYAGLPNVRVEDGADAFEASNVNADRDRITIRVTGSDEIAVLIAQFNNLGKGAAGAAVQNMNLMLGFDEHKGLIL